MILRQHKSSCALITPCDENVGMEEILGPVVFGQQLRLLRIRSGLKQEELAQRMGWGESQSRISNYERGLRAPKFVELLKFCNLLRCTPNDLLLDSPVPELSPEAIEFGALWDKCPGEWRPRLLSVARSIACGPDADPAPPTRLGAGKVVRLLERPRIEGGESSDAVVVEKTKTEIVESAEVPKMDRKEKIEWYLSKLNANRAPHDPEILRAAIQHVHATLGDHHSPESMAALYQIAYFEVERDDNHATEVAVKALGDLMGGGNENDGNDP